MVAYWSESLCLYHLHKKRTSSFKLKNISLTLQNVYIINKWFLQIVLSLDTPLGVEGGTLTYLSKPMRLKRPPVSGVVIFVMSDNIELWFIFLDLDTVIDIG